MRIALIVAMAHARVIGRDNGLPWHLTEDLRHFKALTMGKPIVMGRRTWESIGRPLPGRTSIVVSTNPALALPDGVLRAATLDEALAEARRVAVRDGVDELMVIGGAAVYAAALPQATRIYLTEIDLDAAGDAFFPPLEAGAWRATAREEGRGKAEPGLRYRFLTLERVDGPR
jgi:dihydrofolate reductase